MYNKKNRPLNQLGAWGKKKKSPKNVNLEEYINFSFFMLSYTFLLLLFFHVLMDGFFLFYFF